MSGDSEKPTLSDRRLMEHVLEGSKALQLSVSELHLVVANYHSEAKQGNALLKQSLEHQDEKLDAMDGELSAHVTSTETRLSAIERKLVVIGTAYTAALLLVGGLWALYGDAIKKAVAE